MMRIKPYPTGDEAIWQALFDALEVCTPELVYVFADDGSFIALEDAVLRISKTIELYQNRYFVGELHIDENDEITVSDEILYKKGVNGRYAIKIIFEENIQKKIQDLASEYAAHAPMD